MTFDESNARLTDCLTGRTIDYVTRKGLELSLHTTDGHEIVLQTADSGDICFKQMNASVILPRVSMVGVGAKL